MKKAALFGIWLIASSIATAVSWAGVAVVDSQVIGPANAIQVMSNEDDQVVEPDPTSVTVPVPSAERILPETVEATPTAGPSLADAASTTTPEATTDSGSDDPRPTSSPTSTPLPAAATPVPTSTPLPAAATPVPTSTPLPAAATPVPTSTPLPAAATPVPTSTPLPAPTLSSSETRTVTAVGGTVAFEFFATEAVVLWASPNAGFTVDVNQQGDRVEVEFESSSHESRISAWSDGAPAFSIEEKAD